MNNNSKILLTVSIGGRLGATVSNAASKELISKVKTSSFEQSFNGKYVTPKDLFLAPNDFKARVESICLQRTTISGEAIMFFISDKNPYSVKKFLWGKMTDLQKIKWHLGDIADGNPFTFEILE